MGRSTIVPAPGYLEGLEGTFGGGDDLPRHPGHAGHVDAETVRRAPLLQQPQENHLLPDLLHRHMEILDPGIRLRQVVQFVVVRREQRLRPVTIFMNIFHDRPGDGHPVIGRGAPADLVQQHQRTGGEVVEDHRRLQHLHHEGGLAAGDVVGSADAGENLVEIADAGGIGGDVAADLGQQHDEGRLPQEGRLAGHVRPRQNDDLLPLVVQMDIVGNIFFARRHQGLDDRMAARLDVQFQRVRHLRPAVAVPGRQRGEAGQHVQPRDDPAVGLDRPDVPLDLGDQVGEHLRLQRIDPLFRPENLLFIFLQLLGDVPLRIDQRLLSDPLRRHQVPEGVADLDIVPEDVVVTDFERGDSGTFRLPLLHVQQIVLAARGDVPQFIQLRADTGRDHRPLPDRGGRFRLHRAGDGFEQLRAVPHPVQQGIQRGDALALAQCGDRCHLGQPAPQLHHFPRDDLAGRGAGQDPLQIADAADPALHLLPVVRCLQEMLDDVVPPVQFVQVHHRHRQPAAQQPGAHRGSASVDYAHQRNPFSADSGCEYLQIPQGELVHPHELVPVDPGQGADVPQARVLRLLQIDHQRPGRTDAQREAVHCESLQRIDAELLLQPLRGRLVDEGPFLDGGHVELLPEPLLDPFLVSPLHYDLLRMQGRKQGADVVQLSLGDLELAGGDVQKGCPALILFEAQAAEEVVLLLVQQLLVEGDARRDEFRHSALYEFLSEFRVFQLVADRHLVAGADQFREVGVDGMVREAGHVHEPLVPVGLPGQHDAQHLADQHGVVGIGFIEIPHPVEEHRFGVLRLHREKLLDQRSVFENLSFRHAGSIRAMYKCTEYSRFFLAWPSGKQPSEHVGEAEMEIVDLQR